MVVGICKSLYTVICGVCVRVHMPVFFVESLRIQGKIEPFNFLVH